MGVTYGETRWWATHLRAFTASELSDVMGVPADAIEGFLIGLMFNGTIEDTGVRLNGRGPEEPLYAFVPLPPGPTEHPHYAPEWMVTPGVGADLAALGIRRGMPIRIRTERKQRKGMSTPGQRQKMRMAEKRYQRSQEAKEERAEKRRIKHQQQMERRSARDVRAAEKAQRRRERKREQGLL